MCVSSLTFTSVPRTREPKVPVASSISLLISDRRTRAYSRHSGLSHPLPIIPQSKTVIYGPNADTVKSALLKSTWNQNSSVSSVLKIHSHFLKLCIILSLIHFFCLKLDIFSKKQKRIQAYLKRLMNILSKNMLPPNYI